MRTGHPVGLGRVDVQASLKISAYFSCELFSWDYKLSLEVHDSLKAGREQSWCQCQPLLPQQSQPWLGWAELPRDGVDGAGCVWVFLGVCGDVPGGVCGSFWVCGSVAGCMWGCYWVCGGVTGCVCGCS